MSQAVLERPVAGEELGTAMRFGRNVSYRLGAQIVSALVNVAGMVLLGNRLSAAGYGDYVFWYSLVPLIASLSDLGTGVILTREIARDPAGAARRIGDGILIKIAVVALVMAVVGPTLALLDGPHAVLVCLIVATATFDFSQDVGIWAFRAHERLDLEALLLLASQGIWIGGLALGAMAGAGVAFMIGCSAVAFVLRWVGGLLLLSRRFYAPVFALDRGRLLKLAAQGLPLGLAMFSIVLYGRIGVFLLKAFSHPADVAEFNVAYMLSQPLGFVSSALSMAGLPILSRYAVEQGGAISAALRRGVRYQFLVTLPLMVALYLLADRIVALLFPGGAFHRAADVLRLISLGLVPIFLNLMSRYALAAMDRQRVYLAAVIAGLVTNALAGLALIPGQGSQGAAVAFVCAELVIAVICQAAFRRHLGIRDLLDAAWKPALAAAVMGVVVQGLVRAPLAVVVVAGALTYAGMLAVLRVFAADEVKVLRHLLLSFRGHAPAGRMGRVGVVE